MRIATNCRNPADWNVDAVDQLTRRSASAVAGV
jgi:hypothetical protein